MFRQGRRLLVNGASDVGALLSKVSSESQIADRLLSGKLASCSSAVAGSGVGTAEAVSLRALVRAFASVSRSQGTVGQRYLAGSRRQASFACQPVPRVHVCSSSYFEQISQLVVASSMCRLMPQDLLW